jgi:hypothetical protein
VLFQNNRWSKILGNRAPSKNPRFAHTLEETVRENQGFTPDRANGTSENGVFRGSHMNQKHASYTMLGLLTLVILFHLSVITQLVPYTIVWAGKMKSVQEMYLFESVSIAINLFLITVVSLKIELIKHAISHKILNGILWFFVVLFSLNTVGNLFAKTDFEKYVFTPLTLISAILIWCIVRNKKNT